MKIELHLDHKKIAKVRTKIFMLQEVNQVPPSRSWENGQMTARGALCTSLKCIEFSKLPATGFWVR